MTSVELYQYVIHFAVMMTILTSMAVYLTSESITFRHQQIDGHRRQDGHHHREVNQVLVKLYTCHNTQQRYEIMLT